MLLFILQTRFLATERWLRTWWKNGVVQFWHIALPTKWIRWKRLACWLLDERVWLQLRRKTCVRLVVGTRAIFFCGARDDARLSVPMQDQDGEDDQQVVAAKPGEAGFRWHAAIPQAATLDYVKQPAAKVSVGDNRSSGSKDRSGKIYIMVRETLV